MKTGNTEHSTVAGETVSAFVPFAMGVQELCVRLEGELARECERAEAALSRLDLLGGIASECGWIAASVARKEAVTSSQIAGSRASLVDSCRGDLGGANQGPDVAETRGLAEAMEHAREELGSGGLPVSMRLLNNAHWRLMLGSPDKAPGEVRRSQSWIGGTRPGNASFVPPPPERLPRLLQDLERYVNSDSRLPPLVRVGLVHAQFETIHPYLDGNGRVGRMLVELLLCHWKLLGAPMLNLSRFLKESRGEYFRCLDRVSRDDDWDSWLLLFLRGVAESAQSAEALVTGLANLVNADRNRLLQRPGIQASALRLFERLPHHPVMSVAMAASLLGATVPTATRAVAALAEEGMLVPSDAKKSRRTFLYEAYLDRLRPGTEADSPRG